MDLARAGKATRLGLEFSEAARDLTPELVFENFLDRIQRLGLLIEVENPVVFQLIEGI